MEAVNVSCEKPLDAAASNRHTWTEVCTIGWTTILTLIDPYFPVTIEYKDLIEKLINLAMNTIVDAPTKTGPKTQTATAEATGDSEQRILEPGSSRLLKEVVSAQRSRHRL
ncbi:hypothetical protein BS47DRAFT_1348952, partial [Hydnum rufescens UP504]